MARTMGPWMSGSEPGSDLGPNDYPGQRLGLPETGPGSIARFGRRFAGLVIDWLIAAGLTGIAPALGLANPQLLQTSQGQTLVMVVWVLLGAVSVRLFGFTPGQLTVGIRVASVDHRTHVGIGRALVRGLLIVPVIPALFTDADYRGLQDLATKTAVVRR
jgi:uncharacterized RDD family membrane protein YckC